MIMGCGWVDRMFDIIEIIELVSSDENESYWYWSFNQNL